MLECEERDSVDSEAFIGLGLPMEESSEERERWLPTLRGVRVSRLSTDEKEEEPLRQEVFVCGVIIVLSSGVMLLSRPSLVSSSAEGEVVMSIGNEEEEEGADGEGRGLLVYTRSCLLGDNEEEEEDGGGMGVFTPSTTSLRVSSFLTSRLQSLFSWSKDVFVAFDVFFVGKEEDVSRAFSASSSASVSSSLFLMTKLLSLGGTGLQTTMRTGLEVAVPLL